MQIAILGPVEVTRAGESVPVTGARVRALLTRLALGYGRAVGTPALVDAIWGESPPADAANALQTLVSRLRRALDEPGAVLPTPGGYRLAITADAVDAHRFADAVHSGRRELHDGQLDAASQTLTRALALWRGPVLADLDPPPPAADELTELRIGAEEDRLEAEIRLGNAADVVAGAEGLAAAHPLRERCTELLMRALAAAGRGPEALAVYERLRRYLADELGSDPSAPLQRMHVDLLRGAPGDTAAAEPRHRTNLRAQRTTFLGRSDEAKRVDGLLDQGRLATIIGPGGAGKTRLAAVVADDWLDRMDDGVWLVELAPVTDPAGIAVAVLGSLGLRANRVIDRSQEREVMTARQRLLEQLAESECLLIMDNCEHLITAVAELVDELLARCPTVRILATSREPLGIDGESLCQLPPLSLPPPDVTVDEVLAWPSVQLFADRAAAVAADFAITPESVGDVVEIVRRLDGLPLAIELAAARLRVMPVAEIARRLSDRFRLLTGGSRTAMPRHRTLRAVVEWSWDLLTPAEQRLAERLAIFPSGATVESATAICAGPDLPAADIADRLSALVEKSLLQIADGPGLRYRMLETIREFGTEQLADRGEIAGIRSAHARYFAELAGQAESHLRSAEQLPWVRALTTERDNILAALRFLGDSNEAQAAVELARALSMYWTLTGNHTEAATWIGFALAVPDPAGTVPAAERDLGQAILVLNSLVTMFGDTSADEIAHSMAQVERVNAQLVGYPAREQPMIAFVRPMLRFFAGEIEGTIASIGDALDEVEDPWIRAALTMFRANLYENEGDIANMRVDTERALELFSAIGDRWGLASTLSAVGMLATIDGDLDAAITAYRRAVQYVVEFGAADDEAFTRLRIADLCLRNGDVAGARAEAGRIRVSRINAGSRTQRLMADTLEARIARHTGDTTEMRAVQASLSGHLDSLTGMHPLNGHMRAMAEASVAVVDLALGETDRAGHRLVSAYLTGVETKDMPIIAAVAAAIAAWTAQTGRPAHAAEILGTAAALRGAEDATDPDFVALSTRLRAELGDDEFTVRYAAGRALDRAAALARVDPRRG
jgi:predicted ATPase/DNA-binding SARP family transcriptional activator